LKNLAVSKHFQKQLKNLSPNEQKKTASVLKKFLHSLKEGVFPQGFGFKKINGDKYEIRVDIQLRIAIQKDGDTLVCHVIGNHEDIKRYLKNYRKMN
jgi:mRNA-degrading endonuclease RelE of RelBE toxin-antitoxin system